MELEETVALMNSADYKDRFRAEYFQVKIRAEKLKGMLEKWSRGELSFTPTCPFELLNAQLSVMESYATLLEARASLELIDLVAE